MRREGGLRERKKREQRRAISEVATRLFFERGFESVTVAEIAEAASVSKMTVFNYFPRKEDLFFDREDEGRAMLREAFGRRAPGQSPLAVARALADDLVARQHPFAKMTDGILAFWRTVADSPALRARSRELLEELEDELAAALAASVGAPRGDPTAQLLATTLVGAWRVAYREALRRQRAGARKAETREAFAALLDRGFAMAHAGASGTPYA